MELYLDTILNLSWFINKCMTKHCIYCMYNVHYTIDASVWEPAKEIYKNVSKEPVVRSFFREPRAVSGENDYRLPNTD